MRSIIVAGYPKSGNTWLVRLTAELVGCPVAGFWGHPDTQEIAIEGADRISPYRCFKAHQPFTELGITAGASDSPKVIYVVRDPRDVAVSSAHYHYFQHHIRSHWRLHLVSSWMRLRGRTRKEICHRLFSLDKRRALTITAMIEGGFTARGWGRLPWRDHVAGYQQAGVLLVRYEDMLTEPERECARVLAYLGEERNAVAIRKAIEQHDFQHEKERFALAGETAKAEFLRRGHKGEWRTCLTTAQQKLFRQWLGDILRQLNYDL